MTMGPHAALEHALYGFLASQTLFATVELGLSERLADGSRLTAGELATACGAPTDAVERLLLGAVALRLLEVRDGRFSMPEALRPCFKPTDPAFIGHGLGHLRDIAYRIAPHLGSAVRENAPQWNRIGFSGPPSPFASIYADRESTRRFLDTMWALGHEDSCAIIEQDPLASVEHLLDIGGGSGSFCLPALRRHPRLRATVLDLPPVGEHLLERAAAYGVADRLSFVAGDMFKDPLPPADACAFGYILSDWSDDQGTALLSRVHAHLPDRGRVLVLERLFDEDKSGPFAAAMMNLGMLLETHGKHRSESEYRTWLTLVGYAEVGVVRSRGAKHLVWGRK
jgi:hypothetical protein